MLSPDHVTVKSPHSEGVPASKLKALAMADAPKATKILPNICTGVSARSTWFLRVGWGQCTLQLFAGVERHRTKENRERTEEAVANN